MNSKTNLNRIALTHLDHRIGFIFQYCPKFVSFGNILLRFNKIKLKSASIHAQLLSRRFIRMQWILFKEHSH